MGNATTFCNDASDIFYLLGIIINVIKIVIPIIIILLAILDLGKASMAGEEKEIKEAQKMLLKRIIYGVLIFFVVTILQVLLGLVGQSNTVRGSACWACATSPGGAECTKARNSSKYTHD